MEHNKIPTLHTKPNEKKTKITKTRTKYKL